MRTVEFKNGKQTFYFYRKLYLKSIKYFEYCSTQNYYLCICTHTPHIGTLYTITMTLQHKHTKTYPTHADTGSYSHTHLHIRKQSPVYGHKRILCKTWTSDDPNNRTDQKGSAYYRVALSIEWQNNTPQ